MSAYFVDKTCIDALVSAAIKYGVYTRLEKGGPAVRVEPRTADHFGKMLWRMNKLSIETRYTQSTDEERSSMQADIDAYEFQAYDVTPAHAMGAANCYAYQTCEIEKWEASRPQLFCLKVQAQAGRKFADLARMPGSPERFNIPWGFSDSEASKLSRALPENLYR